MTPDNILAWGTAIGSLAAVVISVLSYFLQARQTRNEDQDRDAQREKELKELQANVAVQVWGMANDQLEELTQSVIRLRKDLEIEKLQHQELTIALDIERTKRRKLESDQKRLIKIIISLLQQMGAHDITPQLSDEDLRWVELFDQSVGDNLT